MRCYSDRGVKKKKKKKQNFTLQQAQVASIFKYQKPAFLGRGLVIP